MLYTYLLKILIKILFGAINKFDASLLCLSEFVSRYVAMIHIY